LETNAVIEGRLQRGGASEHEGVRVGVRLVVGAERGTRASVTTLESVRVGVIVVGVDIQVVVVVVGIQVAARPCPFASPLRR
jgi:hypothetical protein